jgi:AraC-like DNA-binding protein
VTASSREKTRSLRPKLASISAATGRLSRGRAAGSSTGQSLSGGQLGFLPPVYRKISPSISPIMCRESCIIYLPSSHFSPNSLGVHLDKSVIASLRYESSFQDPLLAEIAYAIASELQTQTSAGRLLVETLASSLAARLVQNHVSSPAQVFPRITQQGLDRRRLSRVLDYIEANLEDDLTVDHLASIACLSRFHFARAFKAGIGQAPHQYVSAKRLERAKRAVDAKRSVLGRYCACTQLFLPSQFHTSISTGDRSDTWSISAEFQVKVTKAITRLVWSPASENSVGIYRRRQANHIDSCVAPLSANK